MLFNIPYSKKELFPEEIRAMQKMMAKATGYPQISKTEASVMLILLYKVIENKTDELLTTCILQMIESSRSNTVISKKYFKKTRIERRSKLI